MVTLKGKSGSNAAQPTSKDVAGVSICPQGWIVPVGSSGYLALTTRNPATSRVDSDSRTTHMPDNSKFITLLIQVIGLATALLTLLAAWR